MTSPVKIGRDAERPSGRVERGNKPVRHEPRATAGHHQQGDRQAERPRRSGPGCAGRAVWTGCAFADCGPTCRARPGAAAQPERDTRQVDENRTMAVASDSAGVLGGRGVQSGGQRRHEHGADSKGRAR